MLKAPLGRLWFTYLLGLLGLWSWLTWEKPCLVSDTRSQVSSRCDRYRCSNRICKRLALLHLPLFHSTTLQANLHTTSNPWEATFRTDKSHVTVIFSYCIHIVSTEWQCSSRLLRSPVQDWSQLPSHFVTSGNWESFTLSFSHSPDTVLELSRG